MSSEASVRVVLIRTRVNDISGMVHHSDKGGQYLAVRYTRQLAEAGALASVGSTGDSCDNALAEAFNSLFTAELVRNKGPWRNIDDLEIATAEYVDWFHHRRRHGEIGHVPPAEYEADHQLPRLPSRHQFRASTEPSTRQPAGGDGGAVAGHTPHSSPQACSGVAIRARSPAASSRAGGRPGVTGGVGEAEAGATAGTGLLRPQGGLDGVDPLGQCGGGRG